MKILAVDDNQDDLHHLMRTLEKNLSGCDLVTATSGEQAMQLAESDRFDAAVLDINIPGLDGVALSNVMAERCGQIPMVFVTGETETKLAKTAFEETDIGILSKPIDPRALVSMLRSLYVLHKNSKQVATSLDTFKELAFKDPLTGVNNRLGLDEYFSEYWRDQAEELLSALYIDMDGLKGLNDHFGHPIGDRAIEVFVEILLGFARSDSDLCFRMGGDEFLLLMPLTDSSTATRVALRMVEGIERSELWQIKGLPMMTASVGVACRRPNAFRSPEVFRDKIIELANERMRTAKRAGRNRVVDGGE